MNSHKPPLCVLVCVAFLCNLSRATQYGTRVISPLQGSTVKRTGLTQIGQSVYSGDLHAIRVSAIFDNDFVLGESGVAKISLCVEEFHVDTQSTSCEWAPAIDGDGGATKTIHANGDKNGFYTDDGYYHWEGVEQNHMLRAQITGNTLQSFKDMQKSTRVRVAISLYHADDLGQSLDDTNNANVLDLVTAQDGTITLRGTVVSFVVASDLETDFGSSLVEYGVKDDHESIDHEFRSSFTLDRVTNQGSIKFAGDMPADLTNDDWKAHEAYVNLDLESEQGVLEDELTVSMNRWAHDPQSATTDAYKENCNMTVEFWVRPVRQADCSSALIHIDHTLSIVMCGDALKEPGTEQAFGSLSPKSRYGRRVSTSQMSGLPVGESGMSVHAIVYSKDGDVNGQVFENVLGSGEELGSNAWTHLAFVRQNEHCGHEDFGFHTDRWGTKSGTAATVGRSGAFTVYVNGQQTFKKDDSARGFGFLSNKDDFAADEIPYLRLGAGFNGYIDDVRIWSSARSASQVRQNLLKTAPARALAQEHLAAYWTFDAAYKNSDDDSTSYYRGTVDKPVGGNVQTYLADPVETDYYYIPDQTSIYSEECKYDASPNVPRHCTGVGGKDRGTQAHTLRDITFHKGLAASPSISMGTKKRLSEGTWRFTVGTSYVPNKAQLVDFHSFRNQLTHATDKTINHPSKIRYPGSCSNRIRMEKNDVAWSTLWQDPCVDGSFTHARKCKDRFGENDYLYAGKAASGDDTHARSDGWVGSVGTIDKRLSDLNRNEYHDPNAHWSTAYYTKDMSLSELSGCRVCESDACRETGGSPQTEELAVTKTDNGNVVQDIVLLYSFENMDSVGDTTAKSTLSNDAPGADSATDAQLCNQPSAMEGSGCTASTQHVYGTAFKGHVSARVPTTVGETNSLFYRMPKVDLDAFPGTLCSTDPTTCDGAFSMWLRWKPGVVPSGYFLTSYADGGNVQNGWQGFFHTIGDKRYLIVTAPHDSGYLYQTGQATGIQSDPSNVPGAGGDRSASERTGGAVFADVTDQTINGGWMHVTVAWMVGAYMALYVNGEQVPSNVPRSNSAMSLDLQSATGNKFMCIGGCARYGGEGANTYTMMPDVYFDDYRLFDRAVRQDEAMDMYLSSSFYRGKLSSRLVTKLSDDEAANAGASEELYSFASYQFGISMLGSYGSVSLFQARTFDFQAEFRSATFSDDNHLLITVDTYVRHLDSTFANMRTTKLGSGAVVSYPDTTKDGEFESWGHAGQPTHEFWFGADVETSGRDPNFYCKSDTAGSAPGSVNCPFDFDLVSPETVTCQPTLPLDRPDALAGKTADDYCYQRWTLRTGLNGDTGSKAAIPSVVTDFTGKIPLRFSQMWKSTAQGSYEKRGGDEYLEVTLTVDVRRSALDEELSGNQMSSFSAKRTGTYADINMQQERNAFVRGENVYADLRLNIPGVDSAGSDFWNDERNWWTVHVTEASVCANVDPSAVPRPYDSFNTGSTGCNTPGFVENKLAVFAQADNQLPTSANLATDSNLPNHDLRSSVGFDDLIPSDDNSVTLPANSVSSVNSVADMECEGDVCVGIVLSNNGKAYRLNRDTSIAALFAGDARAKIGVSSIVTGATSPANPDKSALRIRVEDAITQDQPATTDTWSEHIGWSGIGSIAMWYQVIDASQAGILSSGEGNHFRLWTQDSGGEHVIRFAPWGESDDGFWAPAELSLTALGLGAHDWIHVIATWDWGAGCAHQSARVGQCEVNVGLHINGGDEARATSERTATPEIRRSSLVTTVEAGGSAPGVLPVVPNRHPMFHWPSNADFGGTTGAGALYIPSTTTNISPSDETTWIAVDDLRLFLHSALGTDHAQMLYVESSLAASGLPSKFYGLTGAFNSKVIDRRYFDWSSETGISFPVSPLVTDGSNLFLEMRYSVTVNDDIYYKPSDHAFELMTEMLSFDGAGLVNRRRVGVAHFSFEHDMLDIHPPGADIGSIEFSSWQGRVGNYWIPKYTRSHHSQGLALRVDAFVGGYGCFSALGDNAQICGPEETSGDQAWKGFYAAPVAPTDDNGNSGAAWSNDAGAVCLWTRVNNDVCSVGAGIGVTTCNGMSNQLRQRVFTVFDKSDSGKSAVEIYLQPLEDQSGDYHVYGVVDNTEVHSTLVKIALNEWVHTCVTWKDSTDIELFVNGESVHTTTTSDNISFLAGGLGDATTDAVCDNNVACPGYDGAFFVGLPRVVDAVADQARLQMFDVDDIRIFSEALNVNDVVAIMLNTAGDHIAFFSDVELADPILGSNLVAHTTTSYATCSNTELLLSDDCGFRIVADVVLDQNDAGGVIVSRVSQGSSDIDTKAAYHMTISESWSKTVNVDDVIQTRTLRACVGSWLSEAFSEFGSSAPQSDQTLCASVDFDASDVGGQMHSVDAGSTNGVILRFEMTNKRKFTDVGATPNGMDSLTLSVSERDRDQATAITATTTASLPFGFESLPSSSAAALAGVGLQVSSGKRVGYLPGPGERTHIGTHFSDSVGEGTTLSVDNSINTFQGRIAHMSFYSTTRDPTGAAQTTAIPVYNDETRGTQAYFEFDGRRESTLLTDQGPHNVVGKLLNFNQRGQLQLPGKPSGYFTGETRFKLVDMEGGVAPGTVPTTFCVRLSVGTCAAESDESDNPECPPDEFAPVGSIWGAGGTSSPAGRYAAQVDTASASWKYDTVILYRAHGTSGSPSAPITVATEGRAWVKLQVDQSDANCLYASGWCSNVYLVNTNTRVRIVGKSHIGVVDTRALDAKYLPNLGSQGDTAMAYPTTYGTPYQFDASVMIPAHVADDIMTPEYTKQGTAPAWNSGLDVTDGASDYSIESISSIPVASLDTTSGLSATNKLPSTFSMPMIDASQAHSFGQNDGFTACGLFRFSGARCNDACKGGQRLISIFGAKTTSAASEKDGSFTYDGNAYGDANTDAFSNLFLRCEDNGKSRFVEIQHDPNIATSSAKSQTNVIVYGLMDDQAFGVMGGTFAGYHQICWERQTGGNSAISVDGNRFHSAVVTAELHDGLSSGSDWSTSKAYLGQSVGMVAGAGVIYNHIGVLMLGGYGNTAPIVFSGTSSNADISSNWIVQEVPSAHIILPGKVKDVAAWTWGNELSPCPIGTAMAHPYQACDADNGHSRLMFWMGPSRIDQFAYTSTMQDVAWECASDAIAQITSDVTQYTDRTSCALTHGYSRVLKSAVSAHENTNNGFKHPGYSKAYYIRNIQSDNALYPTVAGQNSAASALCVASNAIANVSAVGGQSGAAAPIGPPPRSSNLKVFLYPQANANAADAGAFTNDGSSASSYTSRATNGAVDYDYAQNSAFADFPPTYGSTIPVPMGWHKPVWESTTHANNAKVDGTSPDVHLKLYDECFMPTSQRQVNGMYTGVEGTFSRVRELACDSSGGEVLDGVAKCPPSSTGQFSSDTHNPYTWSMQACVNYAPVARSDHWLLTDGVRGSNEDALHLLLKGGTVMNRLGYNSAAVATNVGIWKPLGSALTKFSARTTNPSKYLSGGVQFDCDDDECSNGPTTKEKLQSPMGQGVKFGFEEPEPKTAEPHNTNPVGQDVDGSFTYCASFRMLPAADKAECGDDTCKAAWPTDFTSTPAYKASYGNEASHSSETSSGSAQGQYYMTSSEVLRVKNTFKDDDGVWQDAILGVSKDANNGYSMTVAYMDAGATSQSSATHVDDDFDARGDQMGSSRYAMHELPFVGSDHTSVATNPTATSSYWDPYYDTNLLQFEELGMLKTEWPMCTYDDPDCDPSRVTPWVDGTLTGGQHGTDDFNEAVGSNAADNTRLVGCIRLDCANHGAFSYHLYGEHGGEIGHTRWGPESNDQNLYTETQYAKSSTAPHFQDYCVRNNDEATSTVLASGASRLQNPDGSDPQREYLFGDSQGAGGPDNQLNSVIWGDSNNPTGARVGPGGTASDWGTGYVAALHHQWQVMPSSQCTGSPHPPTNCIYVPSGGSTVQSLVTQFRNVQLYDRALSESEMAGLAKSENEFNVVSQSSEGPVPMNTDNPSDRYPGSTQNTNADYTALRAGRGRPSRVGAHGLAALKKRTQQLRSAPSTGGQMVAIKRVASADTIVKDSSEFAESGNGDGFGYTAFTVSCPADHPHFHTGNRTCQSVAAYVASHGAPSLPDSAQVPPSKTPTEAMQEMLDDGAAVHTRNHKEQHRPDPIADVAHKEGENTDNLLPSMTQNSIMWVVVVAIGALVAIGGCWWFNTNEPDVYTSTRCAKQQGRDQGHHQGHNQVYHRVASRKQDELPSF